MFGIDQCVKLFQGDPLYTKIIGEYVGNELSG